MILWVQSLGALVDGDTGRVIAHGYAGCGLGKNKPDMQRVRNTGPIPCGWYTVEAPFNSATHGPHAMRLSPDPFNEMFGRSAFMIHGDSISRPGEASEGCIVLARLIRQDIWATPDQHRLLVVNV